MLEGVNDALYVRILVSQRAALSFPMHQHGRVGFE
jgi:hypothetical protein